MMRSTRVESTAHAAASIAAVLLLAALPRSAAGQAPAQQCLLQYETSSGNTRTNAVKTPSGQYNFFQGGGVTYHCEGQNNTLQADSAEYYGDQKVLYLIRNVHYTEPRAKVDSDRMTYYQLEDRLRAEGNVNVRTETGTTIRGPVMDYYRATTTRPLARTIATGRPHMAIIQRTASNDTPEPVDVVANVLTAEGDNLVYASGNVEITRPDLIAKGDSAFLDGQREFARLLRSPSVQSRKGRPFTLTGGVIDLFSRNKVLERVVATPSGHVLSQDLELTADSVDLRVRENQLQRVMAWGRKSRAQALSPERRMIADSIDAQMPGQRLREVRAVGKAYANSVPDTTRIVSTERDWMRGDVLVAEFDSIAPGDTASKPQARRIVATGDASSFYQLAGNTTRRGLPNINYVRGRVINVSFVDKAVDKVEVTDQASGVYLEPTETAGEAGTPSATKTSGVQERPALPQQAPAPAPPRRRTP
ncbi:MAG: LPS export ABC transporter periplasmic protein LptC [Gemmatimonadales bacterium]